MKRLFLILVLLFVYSSAFAQDTEYTVFSPPKVTAEMFEGEAFEDDEDAYAVYLHHCATSMLELVYSKPYRIVKYKGRIRVYKEKGVETYGDDFFKITYNSKNGGQEIRNIVLKCYNINEKGKIKVSETKKKEFVESEYKDKENDIERTTIKVPIKDLKVGSIIDWEYERYTPGQSPAAGWGFQKSVPILYSEYIYQNLSLLDLDRIENGDYFIDEDEEYEGKSIFIDLGQRAQKYSTIVTYTNVADVPAFPDTRYYDNLNEYIANFSFRVKGVTQGGEYHPYTTPWNEIIEKSLEVKEYADFMADAEMEVGDIVMDLNLDNYFEPSEILKVIFDYVKKNYKSTGGYGYTPDKTFSKFMNTKEGDGATNNAFLMALIREAGYEVTPLAVGSRGMGKLDKGFPGIGSLPYMILYVDADGEEFFMDAGLETDFLQWNMPLYHFTDREGLLLTNDGISWKTPSYYKKSSSKYTMNLNVDPAGETTVKAMMTGSGYSGYGLNNSYHSLKEQDSLHLFKKSFEENYEIELLADVTFNNMESKNSKPEISFDYKYEINKDELSFNPFANVLEKTIKDFEAEVREYPIQFQYPEKEIHEAVITIPAGYKFETIPSDLELKMADGSAILSYKVAKTDDTHLTITVIYDYKQRVYSATKYAEFKKMHNDMMVQIKKDIKLSK